MAAHSLRARLRAAFECIKQILVSEQQDPNLDALPYQQEKVTFILENLEKYRRQYVGLVVDGEKRIWCNSFPAYDLLKDKCTDFYVHGEA